MPSRDTSPPPASKINALPPLMSHIDCLSLLLLLSIINKINIPTNLLLVLNDYNCNFSSLREVVYKSNSPRDPFYLKSPIPFIWSMASWLNWKLLQTVKENQTYTFLVRTNNLEKNIDYIEEVSIDKEEEEEDRNHDSAWLFLYFLSSICWLTAVSSEQSHFPPLR